MSNELSKFHREVYHIGVAGGKLLALSLLHVEMLKSGIGHDDKFLSILGSLRAEFSAELNHLED
jgi:hypothetical protein|tara:strand:- start:405 stop:596 length:192 start_codon:yes stop_codon:yes gene_type:complete